MNQQVKTDQDRQAQHGRATHKDAFESGVYYRKDPRASGIEVARWNEEAESLGEWELSYMFHMPMSAVVL